MRAGGVGRPVLDGAVRAAVWAGAAGAPVGAEEEEAEELAARAVTAVPGVAGPVDGGDRDGSPARVPTVRAAAAAAEDRAAGSQGECTSDRGGFREVERHRSQSTWLASNAYPTNATVSITPCATISGHSRPVRRQA